MRRAIFLLSVALELNHPFILTTRLQKRMALMNLFRVCWWEARIQTDKTDAALHLMVLKLHTWIVIALLQAIKLLLSGTLQWLIWSMRLRPCNTTWDFQIIIIFQPLNK